MDFDLADTGAGPALLFLPGSYSTHAAWRGVHQALTGRYRLISTSLPGYGGSTETRQMSVCDMAEMSEFVARVIARIGAPVHLVGHSFGGLVALAAVLDGAVAPRSLITFEANPIFARPADRAFDWIGTAQGLIAGFEAAVAAGDPEAAGLIIDYWSRPGTFAAMPEAFQDYCRATVQTNLLDWRAAHGFAPPISDFAAIDVPVTLVRGEHAVTPMAEISDAIAGAIPDCTPRVVAGAGHFLISTHPEDCAAIIDAHMQAVAV